MYCQLEIKTTKYMKTLRIVIIALISVVTLLTACRRKNEDPVPVITNNTNNNTNTNTTDTTSKNYLKPYNYTTIKEVNKTSTNYTEYKCKSLVISDTTFDIISVTSQKNHLTDLKITEKGVSYVFDTTQRIDLNDNLIITFKTTNIVGKQNTLTMTIPVLIINDYAAVQEEAPRFVTTKIKQYFSKTDPSVKYIVEGKLENKQNRHSYVTSITVSKPELFNVYYDSTISSYIISFVNNIITYEVPIVTYTVSDGKLSSTESYPMPSNFGTGGSNEAYFIMRPYLDKPIKSITSSENVTYTTNYGNTNVSWGSKNYDKDVATPQYSTQKMNGGITKRVWYIDEDNKLFYGNSFTDPNAIRGTITKTDDGFSMYNNISKVTFYFHY